jgi:hypothetical protein
MPSSSYYHDLNPIKYLWNQLKYCISKTHRIVNFENMKSLKLSTSLDISIIKVSYEVKLFSIKNCARMFLQKKFVVF